MRLGKRGVRFLAWILVCMRILAGCGVGQASKMPENPLAEELELKVTPLLNVQNVENTNMAGLLQEKAAGCVVQLQTGNMIGSGVLWKVEGDTLYVATAAHVLAGVDDGVQVIFADGFCADGEDFYLCDDADLAFVAVQMQDVPGEQSDNYLLANVSQAAYDALEPGAGMILMGSARGAAADAYEGQLLDAWCYLEDFEQYMMHVNVPSFPGMSGGGVFDLQGHFLGIFCGGNENGEGAAVPLALMERAYADFIKVLDLSY